MRKVMKLIRGIAVFERRNNETYVAFNLAGRRRTKQFPTADENAEFALDLVRWIQSGRDAFAHPGWTMHRYSTLQPVVESARAPLTAVRPPAAGRLTLTDYFERFSRDHLHGSVEVLESTALNYESDFRHHVLPHLGSRCLSELDQKTMEWFIGVVASTERCVAQKKPRSLREPVTPPVPVPGRCATCGKETENPLYCGHSCRAQWTNRYRVRRLAVQPRRDRALKHRTLAKGTIDRILRELRRVLNRAVIDGYMVENPLSPRDPKMLRELKAKYRNAPVAYDHVQPLYPHEVSRFLRAARNLAPLRIYARFYTEIHAGMRQGELSALEWTDFDWDRKRIRVAKSWSRRIRRIYPTKGKRTRWIEMSARLVPVLQNLRRKLRRDWLGRDQSRLRSEGLWDERNKVPRYVFSNEAGRIEDHANIAERYFRPALRAAGLERRRPHELRHTFASLLLHRAPPSRGVLMYIQRQMGHASLEITINTYAHLIDDLGTRLVDLLPGADDPVPVPDDASTAGEGSHE